MPTREDFKSFASAGFATRALWKQLYSLHLRYMPAFGVVVTSTSETPHVPSRHTSGFWADSCCKVNCPEWN
jgi:hypothetical protein